MFRIGYQIIILYGFYFLGIWLQRLFHLFIPGSIIGMLLLFLLLVTKRLNPIWIEKGATFLLSHLSLLFIPVTVGVVDFLDLFKGRGILSIVTVALSTVVVMLTSAAISQWIAVKTEMTTEGRSFVQESEKL